MEEGEENEGDFPDIFKNRKGGYSGRASASSWPGQTVLYLSAALISLRFGFCPPFILLGFY